MPRLDAHDDDCCPYCGCNRLRLIQAHTRQQIQCLACGLRGPWEDHNHKAMEQWRLFCRFIERART